MNLGCSDDGFKFSDGGVSTGDPEVFLYWVWWHQYLWYQFRRHLYEVFLHQFFPNFPSHIGFFFFFWRNMVLSFLSIDRPKHITSSFCLQQCLITHLIAQALRVLYPSLLIILIHFICIHQIIPAPNLLPYHSMKMTLLVGGKAWWFLFLSKIN